MNWFWLMKFSRKHLSTELHELKSNSLSTPQTIERASTLPAHHQVNREDEVELFKETSRSLPLFFSLLNLKRRLCPTRQKRMHNWYVRRLYSNWTEIFHRLSLAAAAVFIHKSPPNKVGRGRWYTITLESIGSCVEDISVKHRLIEHKHLENSSSCWLSFHIERERELTTALEEESSLHLSFK